MAPRTGRTPPIALAALLGCLSCADPELADATARLSAEPAELEFGAAFVGDRVARDVELRSDGRVAIALAVTAAPEGFLVEPANVELSAGGEARVQVIFAPTATGDAAGELVLGGGGAELRIPVNGTGVGRQVEAPAALDFGPVFLGRVAEAAVRLVNRSALPVTLEGSVTGDGAAAFHPAAAPLVLEAGASGELGVTFAPTARGAASATLLVHACATCPPLAIALSGEGLLDHVVASPSTLDFGTVLLGGSRELDLVLTNRGDAERTVQELRVRPAGDEFRFDGSALPVAIPRDGAATFRATFGPAAAGLRSATLQALDERGEILVEVPLAGLGAASTIAVEPAQLDFGAQAVGSATTRTVRITVAGGTVEVIGAAVPGAGSAFRALPARPLPTQVGAPLDVAVTFAPTVAGAHAGTLVIGTNHPDRPSLTVPLGGTAVVTGPCRVDVRPASVEFGLVTAGSTHRAPVTVANTGTGECRLTGVGIDQPPGSFSVEPVASPLVVAPGARAELEVVFAPPADVFQGHHGTLRFFSNDTAHGTVAVPLSGGSFAGELSAIPDPIDFGTTAPGLPSFRVVELRNTGSTPLRLDGASLAAGTPATLALRAVPTFPLELAPGTGATVTLAWTPTAPGSMEGALEVRVGGSTVPKRVGLFGTARAADCGPSCHAPTAICPGRVITEVAKEVRLAGSGLDPDGDPVSCRWSVRTAPTGSNATVGAVAPCGAAFTADLVGDYELELLLTDSPAGNQGSCVTPVHADPYSGLWLETFWNRDADVDLHLLNPAHHAGIDPLDAWSWGGTDGADCFYWTCRRGVATLAWPDTPGTGDDPSLDFDSQHVGPENTRIDVPSRAHPYWIGVHWLYNPLGHADVTVTTNVYCGGVLAASQVVTLLHREQAILGQVNVNADGTCSFTASGVRVTY